MRAGRAVVPCRFASRHQRRHPGRLRVRPPANAMDGREPLCSMQVSAHSPGHEHLSRGLPNGYKGAMAIAHLIREARERAGLTRAELARRAGVAASTVGRIEAGTRVPSTDLAERLVRAAGFEIRVALGEPDPATDALFERTLRRTPAERLADATRAARFVLRGRRALAQKQ